MKYNIMIGLEVHVQINTKSKLFSSAINGEGDPNQNVNNIDIGIPGSLPRLNEDAIDRAIKTGLALNCEISRHCDFDRKHYFYPDLPLGFQITQFYNPICKGGYIMTQYGKVRLNRIHMETDSGKMIHTKSNSLLDFNRCGIPLMEIVTEPDMNSAESVSAFLIELIQTLKCIETSNCSMDKGNLRADINISIGDENGRHPRVEIKNVNSVNFVRKATECEIERQIKCVENGETYNQHTRRYDSDSNQTIFMRSKETELDYRYVHDFNIPAIHISEERISRIQLPELPSEKRIRYSKIIKNKEILEVIVSDRATWTYFENILPLVQNAELTANFIVGDLSGDKLSNFSAENLAKISNLFNEGKISSKIAKYLISVCESKDPIEIVEKENLLQINDTESIKKVVCEVMSENLKEVEDYKKGKEKLFKFFMGKCIAKTGGRCNAEVLEIVLKGELSK
jgi:aspartyl-tRNA(Asn)/glutamyl-tRNA(Gln) amidotransferase subunit B